MSEFLKIGAIYEDFSTAFARAEFGEFTIETFVEICQ